MCSSLIHAGGPNRAFGGYVALDARLMPYWRCAVAPWREKLDVAAPQGLCLGTASACYTAAWRMFLATPQGRNVSALTDAERRAQRQSSGAKPPDDCPGRGSLPWGFSQRRKVATFLLLLMPSAVRNVNHQAASRLMIARAEAATPLRTLKMSSSMWQGMYSSRRNRSASIC
jgi:hypothetical protein